MMLQIFPNNHLKHEICIILTNLTEAKNHSFLVIFAMHVKHFVKISRISIGLFQKCQKVHGLKKPKVDTGPFINQNNIIRPRSHRYFRHSWSLRWDLGSSQRCYRSFSSVFCATLRFRYHTGKIATIWVYFLACHTVVQKTFGTVLAFLAFWDTRNLFFLT